MDDLKHKLDESETKINELEEKNKVTEEESKKEMKEETKEEKKVKTNEKLKKLYSENQFVKEQGFCYVGTDEDMRHCVEVYNGDICESGDIYKRIDKCLVPESFS